MCLFPVGMFNDEDAFIFLPATYSCFSLTQIPKVFLKGKFLGLQVSYFSCRWLKNKSPAFH